ncbi:MAG: Hsp20/alpha crystallin family protein [Nostocoides sp.]
MTTVTTLRSPRLVRGGMPMDLYRDGDDVVAKLDLPGIDPSTLDIDITDRVLTISAQRPAPQGENIVWLGNERVSGTITRRLVLGRYLAADKIEADYTDGVLTLTAPLAEQAKPRKVTVRSIGSQPADAGLAQDATAEQLAS